MGRQPKNVEFLATLKVLSGIVRKSDFAKACGKTNANMVNYLAGKPLPGKKFLRSCAENLFGWAVGPVMELQPIPKNLNTLPTDPGLYIIYDSGAQVLYLGKATNFHSEVQQTLRRNIPVGLRFGPSLKKKQPKISDLATHLSLYRIPSPRLRHNMEVLLLRVFANQTHNSNIGSFK
jgi:hypothetical protein